MQHRAAFSFIVMFVLLQSSCDMLFPRTRTLEYRLRWHAKEIARSDTSKINFKGLYIHSDVDPKTGVIYYSLYRFFSGGKVFHNYFEGHPPSMLDAVDSTKDRWSIYYIKNNNIYIEGYNGYNGHTLIAGYITTDLQKIIFTEYQKLHHQVIPIGPFRLIYNFKSI